MNFNYVYIRTGENDTKFRLLITEMQTASTMSIFAVTEGVFRLLIKEQKFRLL